MSIEIITFFIIIAILSFFLGRLSTTKNKTDLSIQLQSENDFLSKRIELILHDKQLIQEQFDITKADNQELIARISIRDTEYNHLEKQLLKQEENLSKLEENFKIQFENLANRIFEDKSQKFTLQNKVNIQTLLNPLQEKLNAYTEKVELTHRESIDYHASLRQQIYGLKELNQKITQETINLTKALKGDNKMQGNWGEMILESILEKSGLEKDREFYVQQSFTTHDNRRLQPDVIIKLPNKRQLIIDSKVSLIAYERYINAEAKELQQQFLNEHLLSLKKHVDDLSKKNYMEVLGSNSLDFVLLFVPIETAFSTAINKDHTIYNTAFDKNIIIVTPSTLLATLRTIETMWKQEKQQENAYEIARQAGALYDKFVGFTTDLQNIGRKLNDATSEFDKAFNKLQYGKGNLITSSEKLKTLGAKAKKSIDESFFKEIED